MQNVNNPGSVSPADQVFGHGMTPNQPAPGGPLPADQRLDVLTLEEVPDGVNRKAVSPSDLAAAHAFGDAGVTEVTGTGKGVLSDGATLENVVALNELTTAKITRLSNMEYLVANGFDPVVTGIAGAPVGARASTADGTQAWLKWGVGNRQWEMVHSKLIEVVGAGVSILELPGLDIDATGPVTINYDVINEGAATTGCDLFVNGAIGSDYSLGWTAATVLQIGWPYLAGHLAAWAVNSRCTGTIRVFSPNGSAGQQTISYESRPSGQNRRGTLIIAPGTNIVSIGIHNSDAASKIKAGSKLWYRTVRR